MGTAISYESWSSEDVGTRTWEIPFDCLYIVSKTVLPQILQHDDINATLTVQPRSKFSPLGLEKRPCAGWRFA